MLADLVKAGKLPAVDLRLPKNPMVMAGYEGVGKFGGAWRRAFQGVSDTWGPTKVVDRAWAWFDKNLNLIPRSLESWSVSADGKTWTIKMRQGLKWSDGKPWSVDDIMFWWEDEVQTPDLKEDPPDEARSGKGTLFTMTKVDDNTLHRKYDAPTPLTIDRLAMWVNRGIGPRWMDPKHYMQQFHPKYNTSVDKTKWVDNFILMREFAKNPDCPTMTGWMLTQYNKGQSSIWSRNPYYWCVDKDGNQLPYLDGITQTNIQDPQVMRLRINNGQVDYVHGGHTPLNLADVSTLKQGQATSKLDVRFWDGGDGTGQACPRKRSDAKDAPPRGAAVVLQSISLPLPARAPARGNSKGEK